MGSRKWSRQAEEERFGKSTHSYYTHTSMYSKYSHKFNFVREETYITIIRCVRALNDDFVYR